MKNWPDYVFKLFLLVGGSLVYSTGCAQEMSLRQAFGGAVDIIEQHTIAEVVRLKVVSVTESRQYTFKTIDRIVGYPATGKLVSLNKEKSQQLTTLLLDKNNYANIRQRCLNQYFHGIRFSKGQQKVEVAFGIPCNQVIVAFQNGEKVKWWGGVLGSQAARQVQTLLGE